MKSKEQAQQRVDQITAFQRELQMLEQGQVLRLLPEQSQSIEDYHRELIQQLAQDFDIDTSTREKQFSLGMKIASFLGALALTASIFLLFYRFWGQLTSTSQVVVLVLAPLATLAATFLVRKREKTGYFSKILALISLACFILNLGMLGQIFNITPSPLAFLTWATYALLLAYAIDARLLLAAGIVCLAGFLSAETGTWSGCYWLNFGERPENFFPTALVLLLLPLIPHHRYWGFAPIYRVFGLLFLFIPILILANWGDVSYLPFTANQVEILYQLLGFLVSGLMIFLGVRYGLPEMINTGNVFFTIFLYTKFYDWWWNWMPKYMFFLIIGLTAILMLLLLGRLRKVALSPGSEEERA